jgi:hypothetical protein
MGDIHPFSPGGIVPVQHSYLMEGVPNWRLNSENQHTFNGISEKRDSPKMSTVTNPTFTFDLTQRFRFFISLKSN